MFLSFASYPKLKSFEKSVINDGGKIRGKNTIKRQSIFVFSEILWNLKYFTWSISNREKSLRYINLFRVCLNMILLTMLEKEKYIELINIKQIWKGNAWEDEKILIIIQIDNLLLIPHHIVFQQRLFSQFYHPVNLLPNRFRGVVNAQCPYLLKANSSHSAFNPWRCQHIDVCRHLCILWCWVTEFVCP